MLVEPYPKEIEKVTPKDIGLQRRGTESCAKSDIPKFAMTHHDWQDARFECHTAGKSE